MKWSTPRLRMGPPTLKIGKRKISPSRADGAQGRKGCHPAPDLSRVRSNGERHNKQMEDRPFASNWKGKYIARYKIPSVKKKSVESADSEYLAHESAKDDDGGRYAHAQIVV